MIATRIRRKSVTFIHFKPYKGGKESHYDYARILPLLPLFYTAVYFLSVDSSSCLASEARTKHPLLVVAIRTNQEEIGSPCFTRA